MFSDLPYSHPLVPSVFQFGISWTSVSLRPIHFHGAVMAMFASLIAPFGGFFASGFKRAFKLKVST